MISLQDTRASRGILKLRSQSWGEEVKLGAGRGNCLGWGQQAGCIQLTLYFPPQSPVAAKKEKKVSCMFIPDGRVSVSAQIDRKGFCEGRSLPGSRSEGWGDEVGGGSIRGC